MTFLVLFILLISQWLNADATITDFGALDYDHNHRLARNYLFYAASAPCARQMARKSLPLREVVPLSDELMAQILKRDADVVSRQCALVCVERGYHRDFVADPLPQNIGLDVRDIDAFTQTHCQRKELSYRSFHPAPVHVYWIDARGDRHLQGTLSPTSPGNTGTQTSYLSHRFEFRDAATDELLREYTVSHEANINIGPKPPNPALAGVQAFLDRLNATARETFALEWQRSQKIKRTFTEFGFQKSKLPRDVWGSMTAYYYNNEIETVAEDWSGNGIYVNWWEQNAMMTRMTTKLKDTWAARLQSLIEAWIGEPVEPTSLYGMRKYQEGARLLTHVDREKTHAASLIINIAQGGIREPWKIEIYDHAYRLHEVEMEPGDIVYYESARCLHGRMKALNGSYYVNLFSHYRPLGSNGGDDEWYLRENPPGSPPPALDIGDCSVGEDGLVHCTGPYDVSTLSPILQQLTGPQDLFDYWTQLGASQRPVKSPNLEPSLLQHSLHSEL